ncbi:MAG: cobalamin-independent methionine synthase II family protein [Chloroflexi bacterium]|nr:cobalamin-independent methionine synthase II family protein [Chloroflexota bacterium]
MQRSTSRILTTHTGSLPRPGGLRDLILAQHQGHTVDAAELDRSIHDAVFQVVAKQVECGVDVPSDGEQSRVAFNAYAKDRLSGFGKMGPRGASPAGDHVGLHGGNLDRRNHPDYGTPSGSMQLFAQYPACDGPITYTGQALIQRDIANFKAALDRSKPVDAFLTSVSPGTVATIFGEGYYASYEDFVMAIADAMAVEYKAITDSGLTVQLDAPDLAMERHMKFSERSEMEFVGIVDLHIAAVNRAVRGLPKDQVRLHICWGNYPGPHDHDIPLRLILPTLLKAEVGALSIEASNPRHEHEWRVFEDVRLPAGMILIPGVIDSCTNYVDHPELVAERIVRLARLVGPSNLIAGSDCGYGTFVGSGNVAPSVVWSKFQSLSEGARLASRQLF